MVGLKLSSDFAKKIAETLNVPAKRIEELFEITEDKQGFFIAKLQSKKWLDKPEFKILCSLAKDLGGEYVEGQRIWKVPSSYAKREQPKPVTTSTPPAPIDTRSKPQTSGVTPPSLAYDKSKPPDIPNLKFIPVEAIKIPPFLPTRELTSYDRLSEIRESIKRHGLKYPIKVRRFNSDYELIDGYLRLKCVQQLGWKGILAEIKDATDQEVVVESLITNKHRIEEDPITVAKKFDILINAFGYTQEKLAEEIGISREQVANSVRLLKLPKEIQHCLALNNVSFYHALLLLTLEDPQLKVQLAREVVDKGLSTRQLEERIQVLQPKPVAPSPPEPSAPSQPSEPSPGAPSAPKEAVLCSRCGDPVEKPVNFKGQLYCDDCFEMVQAESEPSIMPPSESSDKTFEPREEAPPIPEALDIGEFECPECHQHFIVEHVNRKLHRLKLVKQ